jgi:2-haloacid dehalogenase
MEAVVLVVFDINETLLDLAPLEPVFRRHTGVAGLHTRWFSLLIRSALVTTATGGYHDFGALGRICARAVADEHGAVFDDAAAGELAETMRNLPPHPEVTESLRHLSEAGHRLVALGNSPGAVIEAQLTNAGLESLLPNRYSAEQVRVLKPGLAAYRAVLDAEHVEPAGAVMVAAHDWDIAGAQAAGMGTVFVARNGRPLPHLPAPELIVPSLRELNDDLLAGRFGVH